jgi:2-dehydro-3-deoxygalactonokinase
MMPDHTTIHSTRASGEFVGIDWGSSNFRILTFGPAAVESTVYPEGIASFNGVGILAYLKDKLVEHGVSCQTPVLMCGMVGARSGLSEVAYVDAPLALTELGQHLVTVPDPDFELLIVPGVKMATGQVDVMRGEEVQARGWLESNPAAATVSLCLPGTHSKWLAVSSGVVTKLETALTGELFALLCQHSLLVSGQQVWDSEAFRAGVERAQTDKRLIYGLFSTRARVVADNCPPQLAESYLSGLLIGTELLERDAVADVHFIGATPLVDRYAAAAQLLGISATIWDGARLVGLGLQAIWRERRND